MTHPPSPCPYPPDFLAAQRVRLLAARERLEETAGTSTGPASSREVTPSRVAPSDDAALDERLPGEFRLSDEELRRDIVDASRRQLVAVNAALQRMEAGRYGWDAEAGAWLPMKRLAALPTASDVILDER